MHDFVLIFHSRHDNHILVEFSIFVVDYWMKDVSISNHIVTVFLRNLNVRSCYIYIYMFNGFVCFRAFVDLVMFII